MILRAAELWVPAGEVSRQELAFLHPKEKWPDVLYAYKKVYIWKVCTYIYIYIYSLCLPQMFLLFQEAAWSSLITTHGSEKNFVKDAKEFWTLPGTGNEVGQALNRPSKVQWQHHTILAPACALGSPYAPRQLMPPGRPAMSLNPLRATDWDDIDVSTEECKA